MKYILPEDEVVAAARAGWTIVSLAERYDCPREPIERCLLRHHAHPTKDFLDRNCANCGVLFVPTWEEQTNCHRNCRAPKILKAEDGSLWKRCRGCKEWLPIEKFGKQSDKKNYNSYCKTCASQRGIARQKTPEGKLAMHASQGKHIRSVNGRFSRGRNQASSRNIKWELSLDEYAELIILPCHYCGGHLYETGCGLDRKHNEPIYSKETVVPCCGRCNGFFNDSFTYKEKLFIANYIREADKFAGINNQK